ncbi:MAG: hypothetical protein ACRDSF_00225 [Pseudonocardiaceae bacterium]
MVVEGPDKSGKTTLVNEFSLQLALPVHHSFHEFGTLGDVPIQKILEDLRLWPEKPMGVYEGHPIFREYIYGPLHRQGVSPHFMDPGISPLVNRLRTMALIVYCRPPDNMIEDESLPFWDLLFRFPLSNFLVMEHDYSNPQSQSRVVERVERRIEQVREWEDLR